MRGYKVDGGKGDPTRPPFLALGKELWTGQKALIGKASSDIMAEEIAAADFENKLRDEYNGALKPGDKALPHRDVPKR
jgi:hypothetical protein